jgi:hypothetical protein
MLRAPGVLAAVAFLRNAFRVLSSAWNILCHCKILTGLIARYAVVAQNVIACFGVNAAALARFDARALQALGSEARCSVFTLTAHDLAS